MSSSEKYRQRVIYGVALFISLTRVSPKNVSLPNLMMMPFYLYYTAAAAFKINSPKNHKIQLSRQPKRSLTPMTHDNNDDDDDDYNSLTHKTFSIGMFRPFRLYMFINVEGDCFKKLKFKDRKFIASTKSNTGKN